MEEVRPGMVIEGYEFEEVIHRNSDSCIYRVRSVQFNRKFCAKVTFIDTEDVDRAWHVFDSEIRALCRLDHHNIIKLYAHFRYDTNFILVLEYCPNGSLLDYIHKSGPVRTSVLARIVREVCSALRYAWQQGVQHRDIRPAKIMFDETGRVKLVDFGGSTIENASSRKKSGDGKLVKDFRCYEICAAPELLMKRPHDPQKTDVWALGVTILWMLKGDVPWRAVDREHAVRISGNVRAYIPKNIHKTIHDALKQMLALNPKQRSIPTEEEMADFGEGGLIREDDVGTESQDASIQAIEHCSSIAGFARTTKPQGSSLRLLAGRAPGGRFGTDHHTLPRKLGKPGRPLCRSPSDIHNSAIELSFGKGGDAGGRGACGGIRDAVSMGFLNEGHTSPFGSVLNPPIEDLIGGGSGARPRRESLNPSIADMEELPVNRSASARGRLLMPHNQ